MRLRSRLSTFLTPALLMQASCAAGPDPDSPAPDAGPGLDAAADAHDPTRCEGRGSCDDGDPCTIQDFCDFGTCAGVQHHCADMVDCTQDSCEPGTGACLHVPVGDCVPLQWLEDPEADPYLGAAVAVRGDTIVAGARSTDRGDSAFGGTVSAWSRTPEGWQLVATLPNPAGKVATKYAESVSTDGGRIAIGDEQGGPEPADGVVYTHSWAGDRWSSPVVTDGGRLERLGRSVAFAEDGLLLAGAPQNTGNMEGRVFAYEEDDGGWTQVDMLSSPDPDASGGFGHAVSTSADVVVVADPAYRVDDLPVGTAWAFIRSGDDWHPPTRLAPPQTPAEEDRHAWVVAASAEVALVGAPWEDGGRGAAYVFERNGLGWTHSARLDFEEGDGPSNFGTSVAVDQGRIAIGVPGGDPAVVLVYAKVDGAWTRRFSITCPDYYPVECSSLGTSVAISGSDIVIGDEYGRDNESLGLPPGLAFAGTLAP